MPLFTADGRLSKSGLQNLAARVAGQSRVTSPGGLSRGTVRVAQGQSGLELTHDIPIPFWAVITDVGRATTLTPDQTDVQDQATDQTDEEQDQGGTAATPPAAQAPAPTTHSGIPHGFQEVMIDSRGVVRPHTEGRVSKIVRTLDDVGAVADQQLQVPAFEVNGRVVPMGSLVLMWLSDDKSYCLFLSAIGSGLWVRITGSKDTAPDSSADDAESSEEKPGSFDPALGLGGLLGGPPVQYSWVERAMLAPGRWVDRPAGMTDEDFTFPAYCVGGLHVPLDGQVTVRLWPIPFDGGICYLFVPPVGLTFALSNGSAWTANPQVPVSRITRCTLLTMVGTGGTNQPTLVATPMGDRGALLCAHPIGAFLAGTATTNPLVAGANSFGGNVGSFSTTHLPWQIMPPGVKFLPGVTFTGQSGLGSAGGTQTGALTVAGNLTASGPVQAQKLAGALNGGVG